MIRTTRASVSGALTVLVAAAVTIGAQTAADTAKAEIKNAKGEKIGEATLTETPHGVLIRASVTNVPAGPHAFHVHETGKCDAPFTTAGGHFNPAKAQHGVKNEKGMHAGDLPNIEVPSGGALTFEFIAAGVTLKTGASSLLDADGSALVLHEKGDDYATDPAGSAGARIGCGIVGK